MGQIFTKRPIQISIFQVDAYCTKQGFKKPLALELMHDGARVMNDMQEWLWIRDVDFEDGVFLLENRQALTFMFKAVAGRDPEVSIWTMRHLQRLANDAIP